MRLSMHFTTDVYARRNFPCIFRHDTILHAFHSLMHYATSHTVRDSPCILRRLYMTCPCNHAPMHSTADVTPADAMHDANFHAFHNVYASRVHATMHPCPHTSMPPCILHDYASMHRCHAPMRSRRRRR